MLTPYERSQLELARAQIRNSQSPGNLEELAMIFDHILQEEYREDIRVAVCLAPASQKLIQTMGVYGLPIFQGETVGEMLTALVEEEARIAFADAETRAIDYDWRRKNRLKIERSGG